MPGLGDTDGGEETEHESPDVSFRKLVEGTTTHAQFILDPTGEITEWFSGAQSLYGYDPEAAIGESLQFLFADKDGGPAFTDLLAEARDKEITREGWHNRVDGSTFWARFTVSPLTDGSFDGYAVISHDETEQKQYERMLERQNDRLKEFTDILSHDLRSPLQVISGRLNLYKETNEEEHLDAIESTTARMGQLVDDLLSVARQGQVVTDPRPTDIEEVLQLAQEGTLPPSATVEYDPVSTVMADSDRLVQVVENLLRNSVDHGGDDVTVRVGPLSDGFYVEDDGPGIPADDRERVFDHGYTSHPDGTGYGLSVVRSVVGAHGWDIAVTDANPGARFEITGIDFVSESD